MSVTDLPGINNNPTPSLSSALNSVVEWFAGEIAGSPTVLKLAGVASVVVGAIPGDFKSTVIRSSLVLGGYFLTSVVHYAESKKG